MHSPLCALLHFPTDRHCTAESSAGQNLVEQDTDYDAIRLKRDEIDTRVPSDRSTAVSDGRTSFGGGAATCKIKVPAGGVRFRVTVEI
jgi:hypothetical protein